MHIAAKLAVESPVENLRRADREVVDMPTLMRSIGFRGHNIVIRNISQLGFMAEYSEGTFRPGDEVRVRLPLLGTIPAKVVWTKSGQIGCAFKNEIDLQQMRSMLAVTGAAPQMKRRVRRVS